MQFYREYVQENEGEIDDLIASQATALLVTDSGEGLPRLGIFNPIATGDGFLLHLHRADEQVADMRARPSAKLVFQDILATIPSHWIDTKDGGMATQYYRYAEFKTTARVIDEPAAMTKALQAMLDRFQPERGYDPLDHEDALYASSYRRIVVVELAIQSVRTKWKLGQNKPMTVRRHVLAQLERRGQPLDLATARALVKNGVEP